MSNVEQLIIDLQTDDYQTQVAAAEALAAMGEDAQPAIPMLIQTCISKHEAVCNWCTAALEEIGSPAPEQIEELKSLANANDTDVAFWAITLLGRARAAEAVPILTERANDASAPAIQQRAAWALKKIKAA